jgi:tetratricopeptide (TPR) repeat protein
VTYGGRQHAANIHHTQSGGFLLQRQSFIATLCERIIEGGWLFALVLIPSYFNLLSSRHFEPDKATTLRGIVLVMAGAGIVLAFERMGKRTTRAEEVQPGPGIIGRAWQRLNSMPLVVPGLIYALVFIFTTFTSVVPGTSFWGSYQRLQGTYTNLSYIGLAAMIVLTLRRRDQLERLITVAILGSLIAVGYGLVQHYQIDPLPWRGDVVIRVASTMGNSIFVAAYLIMVLPFALYRAVAAFHEARRAPPAESSPLVDLGWVAGYTLLVLGSLAIILSTLKFGAVVRTADLRYWWIYPGSLVVAFALFLVPTLRPHTAERISLAMIWPGIVTLLYVLFVALFYNLGQATQMVQEQPGRGGLDWPLWMVAGTLLVGLGYVLFYTLPRSPGGASRLFMQLQGAGMLIISALILLTIFYTQSRGPWIGGAAGLFVFFTLLLWRAIQRARAEGSPRLRLWRGLLIGEILLTVALAAFVVVFNFSDSPFFAQLRQVPYIGRMGRLLETESGTGLVRRLIWVGDDKAGGAVALITYDPLRTIIGWGPESMFVAYNLVYPPSLANIEARGASPDRSHEAYLDELVTKGLLGLISYLFVLISFFVLAWRLVRRVAEWRMQVLLIACIAVVAAYSVEGLTGIPIVSTLMMLWLTMALVVVAGAIAGEYSLDGAPAVIEGAATEVPEQPARGQNVPRGGRRRQGAAARGASQGRVVARRSSGSADPVNVIVYSIIGLMALAGVWFFNIDNVYADMRFQQGQAYTDNPRSGLEQQLAGMSYYIDAIKMEPQQDFYYLNLGRTLMSITDIRRQSAGGNLGQPKADARIEELLRQPDAQAVQLFVFNLSPLETMSYAKVVLDRAKEINPLNKDHYANLGRLHNYWYSRLTQDPEHLRQSVDAYRRGHEVAPQDVVILNEYASAVALMGSYARTQQDEATAQRNYEEANQLLARSKDLDPAYNDTEMRIADVKRLQGSFAEATDQYVALLAQNPHALDSQINQIIDGMGDQPDQLRRLRDSYAAASAQKPDDVAFYPIIGLLSVRLGDLPRAAEAYGQLTQLQPTSLEAYRNYTLVLSDTRQYQQAVTAAETTLSLAQQQQASEQDQAALQGLLNYLRIAAGG